MSIFSLSDSVLIVNLFSFLSPKFIKIQTWPVHYQSILSKILWEISPKYLKYIPHFACMKHKKLLTCWIFKKFPRFTFWQNQYNLNLTYIFNTIIRVYTLGILLIWFRQVFILGTLGLVWAGFMFIQFWIWFKQFLVLIYSWFGLDTFLGLIKVWFPQVALSLK